MATQGHSKRSVKHHVNDSVRNFFNNFPRIDYFICGTSVTSYDLVEEKASGNLKTCAKNMIEKIRDRINPRVPPTEDEKHLLALFKEGLILRKDVILSNGRKEHRKWKAFHILTLHDNPILNICLGFTNAELHENCRVRKSRTPPAYLVYAETCPIRTGIERVLSSSPDDDYDSARVGGVPVSVWLETYYPVIQMMLMLNKKRNRSSLTKKRRHQLILPPGSPIPIMGDVLQEYFHLMGPPFAHHHRNIMAVVSYRYGELGERQRMRRLMNITDAVIPTHRTPNRNRSRLTQAHPMDLEFAVDPEDPAEQVERYQNIHFNDADLVINF
ncbi:hypothetical protein ACF0H5_007253 [Mactra antiquata]